MSVETTGMEQTESVRNICQFTRNTGSVFITRFPLLAAASALKPLRTAPSIWSKFSDCYTEVCVNPNHIMHLSLYLLMELKKKNKPQSLSQALL